MLRCSIYCRGKTKKEAAQSFTQPPVMKNLLKITPYQHSTDKSSSAPSLTVHFIPNQTDRHHRWNIVRYCHQEDRCPLRCFLLLYHHRRRHRQAISRYPQRHQS